MLSGKMRMSAGRGPSYRGYGGWLIVCCISKGGTDGQPKFVLLNYTQSKEVRNNKVIPCKDENQGRNQSPQ
jgi:hypothetical protein